MCIVTVHTQLKIIISEDTVTTANLPKYAEGINGIHRHKITTTYIFNSDKKNPKFEKGSALRVA
jgi:hypothetical protein